MRKERTQAKPDDSLKGLLKETRGIQSSGDYSPWALRYYAGMARRVLDFKDTFSSANLTQLNDILRIQESIIKDLSKMDRNSEQDSFLRELKAINNQLSRHKNKVGVGLSRISLRLIGYGRQTIEEAA